jgi:hypothetical protein
MPTISKFAAYHTPITTGYTNPSNAYADDGVYATASPGRNAQVSAYFGFPAFTSDEIPDGAIINSVTIEFEYRVSTTASIAIQYWQTFVGTTGLGTEQGDDSEPLTDVVKTHTVTSGITLSDLRTADRVRMRLRSARGNSSTAVTFYIDYVKITVNYNLPPSVTLNSPANNATGVSLTPTLQFTGTDPEGDELEYEVQIDTIDTFDVSWQDSYSEDNQDIDFPLGYLNYSGVGQTFIGDGRPIKAVRFYMQKNGSPTGTLTAKIYNITGTYGTNARPTGTPLAVSYSIDASTLSDSFQLVTFIFPTPYTTTNGAYYAVTCETDISSSTNNVLVAYDATSPTHSGNLCYRSGNTWYSDNTADLCFYVSGRYPLLSVTSDTEYPTNFSGTGDPHPWPSGNQISYAVQSSVGLQPGTDYYWRVRAKDPNGSNTWGPYSEVFKFTTEAGTPPITGSANLTGLGSLSAVGILMKIGNAVLTGIGTLTTTAIKTIFSQASLVGQGTLSAIGSILKQGAAILSGTGSLIAQGAKIIAGQANLIGQGLLSAAGEVISEVFVYGSAVLTGIGQLVASGTKIVLGQANLLGIGSLVSSAIKIIVGQVNLIGNGLLSVTGILIKIGEAILSGVGSLTSSAIKIIFSSASLVGQGFLFAAGFIPSAAKAIKNIILSKFIRFWD